MKKNRLISLIMISFLGCSLAACGGQEKHSKTRLDRSTAQKYESTIAGGMTTTVGLKTDGTVVAVGQNEYGQCDVSEWTDIVAVAAGDFHTVGLKADDMLVRYEALTQQIDVLDMLLGQLAQVLFVLDELLDASTELSQFTIAAVHLVLDPQLTCGVDADVENVAALDVHGGIFLIWIWRLGQAACQTHVGVH